jgi:hypothetical protein
MKKINSLLFIFLLAGTQLFAQKTLTESFDYSTGSLIGVGAATNGWTGPWNEGLTTRDSDRKLKNSLYKCLGLKMNYDKVNGFQSNNY